MANDGKWREAWRALQRGQGGMPTGHEESQAVVRAMLSQRASAFDEHVRNYLETDGRTGYIRDMTSSGGSETMLHLILRTVGRKSGRVILVPLTYAAWADEYVLVASKGGYDKHPAWFLNLIARSDVEWQVLGKRFTGAWRVAEGEERERLWEYVSVYYRGYADYQARTARELPVVVLTPMGTIAERWALPETPLRPFGDTAAGGGSPSSGI